MIKQFEVEPLVRLHGQDGACIEIGTDPDIPEIVQIRTPNAKSVEYYSEICLSLDTAHMRQLIKALTDVCNAVDTLNGKSES